MPDGTIWNGLRRLRKDNTGYCLRQLFVGSNAVVALRVIRGEFALLQLTRRQGAKLRSQFMAI